MSSQLKPFTRAILGLSIIHLLLYNVKLKCVVTAIFELAWL